MNIGVMQGRLSPRMNGEYQCFPIGYWKKEFDIAREFGFDHIEFIYDEKINPLDTEKGIEEVKCQIIESQIPIHNLCADYFINKRISDPNEIERQEAKNILYKLIEKAPRLGYKNIIIPFVDNSSIKSQEEYFWMKDSLLQVIPLALKNEVNLCIEADLFPQYFKKLLTELSSNVIKVAYDSGNSASLGYDMNEEFDLYGNRIAVVHIKDRFKNGKSVRLGKGDVKFNQLARRIKALDQDLVLTMQCFREEHYTNDLETLKKQFNYIKQYLS